MKIYCKVPIAFHKPTETIKHVRAVANGLACEFICSACSNKLEAVQSKQPDRKWYFRHSNKSNCKGSFESDLHKYAKQVILANNSIAGSSNLTIKYIKAIAEKRHHDYQPDIVLELENGEKIYIEIFVSHAVKEIKRNFFISNKLKSFEIDLSKIVEKNHLTNFEELDNIILREHGNRKIIYWPQLEADQGTKDILQIIGAIFFVALFIKLGKLMQGHRKKYAPRKSYTYSKRRRRLS